jgi:hypothetical protein
MAKTKAFQIVVEVENGQTIFDSTNDKKQVEEWIDAFTTQDHAKRITVYAYRTQTKGYEVAQRLERKTHSPTRLVGFGRWE